MKVTKKKIINVNISLCVCHFQDLRRFIKFLFVKEKYTYRQREIMCNSRQKTSWKCLAIATENLKKKNPDN